MLKKHPIFVDNVWETFTITKSQGYSCQNIQTQILDKALDCKINMHVMFSQAPLCFHISSASSEWVGNLYFLTSTWAHENICRQSQMEFFHFKAEQIVHGNGGRGYCIGLHNTYMRTIRSL